MSPVTTQPTSCISQTPFGTKIPAGIVLPFQCGERIQPQDEGISSAIKTLAKENLPNCATSEEANERFEALKGQLKDLHYFPKQATPFAQLVYYAGLSDEQSVYSMSGKYVLEESMRATRDAKAWLRTAGVCIPCGFTVAFCLPACLPVAAQATITSITAYAAGFSSWVGTGTNPDDKSDAANSRQDELGEIRGIIENIAGELIELKNENHLLAKVIADQLNVEAISAQMQTEDPVALAQGKFVIDLTPLTAAKAFIRDEALPTGTPRNIKNAVNIAYIAKEHGFSLYQGSKVVSV